MHGGIAHQTDIGDLAGFARISLVSKAADALIAFINTD